MTDTRGKPTLFYYDDIKVGAVSLSSWYLLTQEDIVAFATKWDPLPIHINPDIAKLSSFKGLTASGTHLMAIKQRLLYDFGFTDTVICSFGFDEVRYRDAARPGDKLQVVLEWTARRLSSSRDGVGVAGHMVTLRTEKGVEILSVRENILIKVRPDQS